MYRSHHKQTPHLWIMVLYWYKQYNENYLYQLLKTLKVVPDDAYIPPPPHIVGESEHHWHHLTC